MGELVLPPVPYSLAWLIHSACGCARSIGSLWMFTSQHRSLTGISVLLTSLLSNGSAVAAVAI